MPDDTTFCPKCGAYWDCRCEVFNSPAIYYDNDLTIGPDPVIRVPAPPRYIAPDSETLAQHRPDWRDNEPLMMHIRPGIDRPPCRG